MIPGLGQRKYKISVQQMEGREGGTAGRTEGGKKKEIKKRNAP